jgi:hypothetical protein
MENITFDQIQVAIIKQGHGAINNLNWHEDYLTNKKIEDEIEDFVLYEKISSTAELFMLIEKYIQPNEHTVLNISDFNYNDKTLLQAIYPHSETKDHLNLNNLATQMMQDKFYVTGAMIILKRNLDKNITYESVKMDDLCDTLRRTLIHKAVYINSDKSIREFYYVYDPLEVNNHWVKTNNVAYHEYKFMNFTLIFYVRTDAEQTDSNLNTLASTIYRQKIYGDVIITLVDDGEPTALNHDMTDDLIQKIYFIMQRVIEVDNTPHKKNIQSTFPSVSLYPNFYSVLNDEFKMDKNKDVKFILDKLEKVLNIV